MSLHHGNSLTVVSPNQQYSLYEVPKFETAKGARRSSYSQAHQQSGSSSTPVSSIPSRNRRPSPSAAPPLPPPLAVTPDQRRRSSSGGLKNIISPQTLDTSSHSLEESKTSPFGHDRHSVIGLPSEYPITAMIHHSRDGSVVSRFESSVASSLLMEEDELEDFEQSFEDDLYGTKVYDDFICSTHQNPLKVDIPKPKLRERVASDNTMESVKDVTTPLLVHRPMKPPAIKRNYSTSASFKGSISSKCRRRKNYGLNGNDFQKITNDFSSLVIQ